MIPIAGTVRNAMKMVQLDMQWQQKKMNISAEKPKTYTMEERQLQQYQKDVEEMRKSRWIAALMNKIQNGEPLTPEEEAYLERNHPQALKEYEDTRMERAAYKEELKKCKSKEEAEQLKMNKMNEFMSAAKTVDSNPNIPKAAKIGLMERILRRLVGIEEEHVKFTRSLRYQKLPDKMEETALPVSDKTAEIIDRTEDTPLRELMAQADSADAEEAFAQEESTAVSFEREEAVSER